MFSLGLMAQGRLRSVRCLKIPLVENNGFKPWRTTIYNLEQQKHISFLKRSKKQNEPSTQDAISLSSQPTPVRRHPLTRFPVYRILPGFFRRPIASFYNQPLSSFVSFVTIYELAGLVPFVLLWYLFQNYEIASYLSGSAFLLPDYMLIKGTAAIDAILKSSNLVETFSVQDTTRLVINGSKAFALTQALFPVRALLAFFGMASFNRRILGPIKSLFAKKKTPKNDNGIWNSQLDDKVKFKKLPNKRL